MNIKNLFSSFEAKYSFCLLKVFVMIFLGLGESMNIANHVLGCRGLKIVLGCNGESFVVFIALSCLS